MRYLLSRGLKSGLGAHVNKSIAGIAIMSLCVSQAFAADLPSRVAPPVFVPPPIVTSWGGCYGGAFGAYDIARVNSSRNETTDTLTTRTAVTPSRTTTTPGTTTTIPGTTTGPDGNVVTTPPTTVTTPPTTVTIPGSTTTTSSRVPTYASSSYGRTDSGGDGGARLGCNYQMGHLVIGGQIEGGYLGISGTATDPIRSTSFTSLSGGAYGAVSGKVGFALAERTLVFVRGGVGYADLRYTAGDYTLNYNTSVRGSNAIPLVGAGLEYKLTDNMSLTGEYTYMRPGCRTSSYTVPAQTTSTTSRPPEGITTTTTTTTTSGSGTSSSCVNKHMISIGLNYYFNTPSPVVARY